LQLHKQHPALQAGDAAKPEILATTDNDHVLAFTRKQDGKEVLVILNFSASELTVHFTTGTPQGKFVNAFTQQAITLNASFAPQLKAWDYLVLVKN
jgi:hypothetical protein